MWGLAFGSGVHVHVEDAPSNNGEVVNALRSSIIDALVGEGVVPRTIAPAPATAVEMCSPFEGWNAPAVQVVPHMFAPCMLL